MRVLISTTDTQGDAADDYFWSNPGEIVHGPTFVCHAHPSSCGCDRAWGGLESRRACTSCVVAEVDLSRPELDAQIRASLADGGWVQWLEPDEVRDWVDAIAGEIVGTASLYEPGTVLGVHWLASDNEDYPGARPRELIVRRPPPPRGRQTA